MPATQKSLPTLPAFEHEPLGSAVSLTSFKQELRSAWSPQSSAASAPSIADKQVDDEDEEAHDGSDEEPPRVSVYVPSGWVASSTSSRGGSKSRSCGGGGGGGHGKARLAEALSQRRRGVDLSIFGKFKGEDVYEDEEESVETEKGESAASRTGSGVPSVARSDVRSTGIPTANQRSSIYSHSPVGSQLEKDDFAARESEAVVSPAARSDVRSTGPSMGSDGSKTSSRATKDGELEEDVSEDSAGIVDDDAKSTLGSSTEGGCSIAHTPGVRRTPLSPGVETASGEPSLTRLQDGLRNLWTTSSFTDLTIHCRHYAYPVHKNILASQSAHFAHAVHHNIISTLNKPDVLEMHSDDPLALKSLLEFFYTGTLTVPLDSLLILGGPAMPSIEILRRVYKLAIKSDLLDLKQLAVKQYSEALGTKWPRGHGLLIAKALREVFGERKDGEEDLEDLREATLDVAVRFVGELVADRVVFDMLEGEPIRAIMGRMSKMVDGKGGKAESVRGVYGRS